MEALKVETPSMRIETATKQRSLPRRVITHSRLTIVATVCLCAWAVIAIAAPLIAPHGPAEQNIVDRLSSPNASHLFGTDPLGRDILSRVVYGSRITIPVGVAVVVLALVLGSSIGVVSGLVGGTIDYALMRITDLVLAFPTIILALVITAALGPSIKNAILAIMVAWWPTYARFVRGLVLVERERDYIVAARTIGVSDLRIALRHILPNVASPIGVMITLDVASAILTFASLSFLGLGVPPTVPEWGAMVALGQSYFDQWWIGTFPGLAIFSVVISLNIVGDSLRDVLDPHLQTD